jgi:hypothetical protein
VPPARPGPAVFGQQLAPTGAKADELPGWGVQVKCLEVGQAAAGGPVLPTPPVAGSISSNADGPTSIRVSGSVTSPVALDQISSWRRLDAVTATASSRVVLMMPT